MNGVIDRPEVYKTMLALSPMRLDGARTRSLLRVPTALVLVVTLCAVPATGGASPVIATGQAATTPPVLSGNESVAEASVGRKHQQSPAGWATHVPKRVAQNLDPAPRFATVSAGGRHSCGVRTDGRVQCWGEPYRVCRRGGVPGGELGAGVV